MMRILHAEHPPVVGDVDDTRWINKQRVRNSNTNLESLQTVDIALPPGLGLFTWDGENNQLSSDPLWGKQFQWIDYIMPVYQIDGVDNLQVPTIIDNRAISLRSTSVFPELGKFWTPECVDHRNNYAKKHSNSSKKLKRIYAKNSLDYNEVVKKNLLTNAKLKYKRDGTFDHEANSYKTTDSEFTKPNVFGNINKILTKDGDGADNKAIIPANPFRMLTEVSDHYGVLATMHFEEDKANLEPLKKTYANLAKSVSFQDRELGQNKMSRTFFNMGFYAPQALKGWRQSLKTRISHMPNDVKSHDLKSAISLLKESTLKLKRAKIDELEIVNTKIANIEHEIRILLKQNL